MPSSTTAGSPSAASARYLHRWHWPSPGVERLGTPMYPIIRFRWDEIYAASLVRFALRPVELLASLADLTGSTSSQPNGDFYARAFHGSVALPVVGYNYGGYWAISTGGTSTH